MLPFSIVKHLDVLKAGCLHCGLRRVTHAVITLVFEAVKPALGRRVIPAVSLAAHRTRHAEFCQLGLIRLAGVLAAPVGVVQHTRRRSPAEPCHCQRIGRQVRRHARLKRPADHLPIEQIQYDCQVQPALVCPQVRAESIGDRNTLTSCIRIGES